MLGTLPSFPLFRALPGSEYYDGSAPLAPFGRHRAFEARRVEHYGELRKPLDPTVFTRSLRQEMAEALAGLDEAVPELDWVEITERKAGAIKFTAPEAQEEPRNLRRVKSEVGRRWSTVPLIDMLKEAVLRTGCLKAVASVAAAATCRPRCWPSA